MDKDRVETSPHIFWKLTCDVDTYRKSPQHARHDTPWNAFSPEEVLVCTLWRDQILDIEDDAEGGRLRRFVRLGGKMREWKGPAVAHGREADENLRRAAADKLRVVGYEADPESGDEIDVFFRSGHQWIGVEVKSCISDKLERDYERGLYQAIKYAAVLEAQAQVDHPDAPPIVKVFLVLERTLPSRLRPTAEKLGVSVLENISPAA